VPDELTPDEVAQALKIAGEMIDAGIAIFAAPPCPAAHGGVCGRTGHDTGKEEYDLPSKWQLTVPSRVWLERWRPGWALGAVGGRVADFLDEDPRHGGDASVKELEDANQWPRVFGVQATPSGGFHHLISPVGEREANGFLPGLDYQGGRPDGTGRAFVFIAPTVKRSKAAATVGELHPYRWLQPPDLEYLREFDGGDDTVEGVRTRLAAARERKGVSSAPDDRTVREFTDDEAKAFCNITLDRLMKAEIGEIEQFANDAACQLSHFVPQFWSEEMAYGVLTAALAETAYDPNGPSTWTAEKFHAVLAGEGERAPSDWRAERAVTLEQAMDAAPEDAVDALIAEMLTLSEVTERPAPKYLIKGLLNLESESWIIGAAGSKKSFVTLDMCMHVARGLPWQGLKVNQADVIIVAAEGAGGMGRRVKAWRETYGELPPNVHVLPRPVQTGDTTAWAVLVKACTRVLGGRDALVVLDTQARLTVGLDENTSKDMGIFINAVTALKRATGACVLSVHHTGRSGGDARGSSALDGAQDTELTVIKNDSYRGELRSSKQKDLDEREPLPLRFAGVTVGVDEDGDDVTSLVLLAPDAWTDSQDEARPEEHATAVRVQEPQDWTLTLFEHHAQVVKRQILQTLHDLAGQSGRTEAQVKKAVAERWYGGKVGRVAGALSAQTWDANWTGALAASWAEGKVVVPGEAGGWALSVDYREQLSSD
jgi:hypothetical protein